MSVAYWITELGQKAEARWVPISGAVASHVAVSFDGNAEVTVMDAAVDGGLDITEDAQGRWIVSLTVAGSTVRKYSDDEVTWT